MLLPVGLSKFVRIEKVKRGEELSPKFNFLCLCCLYLGGCFPIDVHIKGLLPLYYVTV